MQHRIPSDLLAARAQCWLIQLGDQLDPQTLFCQVSCQLGSLSVPWCLGVGLCLCTATPGEPKGGEGWQWGLREKVASVQCRRNNTEPSCPCWVQGTGKTALRASLLTGWYSTHTSVASACKILRGIFPEAWRWLGCLTVIRSKLLQASGGLWQFLDQSFSVWGINLLIMYFLYYVISVRFWPCTIEWMQGHTQ